MNECKGCIRTAPWPMKKRNEKGERDFMSYVICECTCDLVTSAGDLSLFVDAHRSVYCNLRHCVDAEGQGCIV